MFTTASPVGEVGNLAIRVEEGACYVGEMAHILVCPNRQEPQRKPPPDNSVQMFLNGVNTGMGASGGSTCCFAHFTAFQIKSGFVQGVNRLDFVVTNDDCGPSCFNPTGLRAEYRVAEVPEPATVTYYVIFGLLAFKLSRQGQPLRRG